MAQAAGPYTVEMLERFPQDGNRYEIVDGELLVTPSPGPVHQGLVTRLVMMLAPYVAGRRVGQLWAGPIDVITGPRTMLEPDVAVGLGAEARRLRSWRDLGRLALVVEILSPSSEVFDRGKKRAVYQQRADEYWIVDPEARAIERWRRGDERPTVYRERLEWQPNPTVAPLAIDVKEIFAGMD